MRRNDFIGKQLEAVKFNGSQQALESGSGPGGRWFKSTRPDHSFQRDIRAIWFLIHTALTPINYTYDNANRLTQIAQGTPTVSFSYDLANRRTSLTLPNGVTMTYSYDNASEVTGISYATSLTTLGNLSYSYDLAGRRTTMGGSLASVNLPTAVSTTGYDAANELTAWGAATPTYDSNGNTTSDGTNSYVWNARNQLASMNSSAESFQYDPLGRRCVYTVI